MTEKKERPIDSDELRRKAEEKLGEKAGTAHPPGTEEEPLRLHHELQVHQVELEMQNAELRQSRYKLETALEKYTDLYDFAPVGYFTLDRIGDILSVNLTGAGFLGVERSLLVGRRFGLFITDEARLTFNAFLEKVFTSPAKEACEVALLKEGNAPRYMQVGGVVAASGQECRIALIDNTEQKRAEEALRLEKEASEVAWEREEQLRLLVDSVKDYAIFMLDVNGHVITWNEGAKRLKGWDAQEVVGRNFSIFYTEEAVATGHPEHELEQAEAEGLYKEEGWRVRKDGSKILADITITAIRDHSGKLRGFSKVIRDITEKKKTEVALRKSEADLALAQSIAHIGSWRLNILTNEVSWSDELYRVFDFEKAEFDGTYESFLNRVHPDDKLRVLETSRKARESGKDFEVEYRIVAQSGELKYLREVGLSTKDAEGRVVELFGVAQDVTPFMEADFQKHKLEAQLFQAQKMESIGRLAGGVAHDFNNMLTVILGNAHLGLMEVDPHQPVYANLKEISKSAERSTDLTRQLLAFARKQTIVPKVIDLNDTVAGMLKMLQRLIGEDIHLIWHPAENLWPVNMDSSQIDQILANLCVNARDAITGVGTISIDTKNCSFDKNCRISHVDIVSGDYVSVSVSDDGHGMDKETLDHIFEPFYTTKEAGKGTGLGLATVYGAVKQNKGYIDFCSELGTGTTFTIYLPRYKGKSGQTLKEDATVLSPKGHETILLVEDELAILKMTTMVLAREGYNVLAANSASEALQVAREYDGEIHLLMTDVVMPEMNGRDLAKNLLSLYPNVKRLFMSGYTADIIAHNGVLDDGLHFIQKPFNMNALAAKLREILES